MQSGELKCSKKPTKYGEHQENDKSTSVVTYHTVSTMYIPYGSILWPCRPLVHLHFEQCAQFWRWQKSQRVATIALWDGAAAFHELKGFDSSVWRKA